ncbi:MAG: hypothetical protein HON83_04910 [Candidatus Marinimicrobia bacterium]|jgi:hypothetical protein|nr:hypothetical protein [Candidatus Neomarinimicrobiota bacterium]MBT6930706.1 hypothetical protein [Candidatus Neomarinimicrobiota bacterium]
MNTLLSSKGKQLVKLYEEMAEDGYERTDSSYVKEAFSDFELRAYRKSVQDVFEKYSVSTVLDYGCGGSDWKAPNFDDSGESAIEYFQLEKLYRYEPARDIDERQVAQCVISFDVLEHIFVSDIPNVLRDMFSYAKDLLVLNVACYPAAAKLPNGENAHITVRDPMWWKGVVDGIAVEYPEVSIWLICSVGWRKSDSFDIWSGAMWQKDEKFVIDY